MNTLKLKDVNSFSPTLEGYTRIADVECPRGFFTSLHLGEVGSLDGLFDPLNPDLSKYKFWLGPRGPLFFTHGTHHDNIGTCQDVNSEVAVNDGESSSVASYSQMFGGAVMVDTFGYLREVRFYHNKIYSKEEAVVKTLRVLSKITQQSESGVKPFELLYVRFVDGGGVIQSFPLGSGDISFDTFYQSI